MGRRWEILHCSCTAAQGIYSRLSEPSEYCLFMCNLILHVAWGLRAAGMTWLQRGKEGLEGTSLGTVGQTWHPVLWEGWCWNKVSLEWLGCRGNDWEGVSMG